MMFRQKEMIAGKMAQLEKMRGYLAYSSARMHAERISDKNLQDLSDRDAEILAAFRARFSEYQEHLGKLLKSVALEEGAQIIGMSDVLAFAEKAGLIDSEQDWKEPRDVRNAINHSYEENAEELSALMSRMLSLVALLMKMHDRVASYCLEKLGVEILVKSPRGEDPNA